jgi:hypothetical protein
LALGLAGLWLLGVPSGAFAVTTIGNNLAALPISNLGGCNPSCTVAQSVLPAASQAPGGLLAPQDGVVVRWRIKIGGDFTPMPVALRITRPGSSDTRTGAGTVPTVTPPTDQTSTIAARLPIQAGDALGIDCCMATNSLTVFAPNPAALTLYWEPSLQDGASTRTGFEFPPDTELLVNADVEPDADRDGFGDETQDQCIGTTGPQNGCAASAPVASTPTGQRAAALKKCKKKHSKKARKRCRKKAKKLPV